MFIKCSFDEKKQKHVHYRGKDCLEKICKIIKECSIEVINHEKRKKKWYH